MIPPHFKIPNNIKNESNYVFWYSMIHEASKIIDFGNGKSIVDFGTGLGGFLRLIDIVFPKCELTGVEIDPDKLKILNTYNSQPNITYISYNHFLNSEQSSIDVFFSQEVVYTIDNLKKHAEEVFRILRHGGWYIFTMGCHIDNPTWQYRKQRITREEKYKANDYGLEEIIKIFHSTGFRPLIKKLSIQYPLTYIPDSEGEFRNVYDMINSCENHKYIFFMLKPKNEKALRS